jgi:hypothetical protein
VTTAWRVVRSRMEGTNSIYKEMSAECTVVDLNEYLEHSATGTNAGAGHVARVPPPPPKYRILKFIFGSFELNSFILTEGSVLRVTLQTTLRSHTTVESWGGGVVATGKYCTSGTHTKFEYGRAP